MNKAQVQASKRLNYFHILLAVDSILTIFAIGFLMYFLQPILLLLLAYVAAYKAFKGEKWDIPLTFKVFK